MILKEAFQYQNYLDGLIREADIYLRDEDFVTTTKEIHLRSKADPSIEDEEIIKPKRENIIFNVSNVIDFLVKAIKEKEKLSDAISVAKRSTTVDIDSSIAVNRTRQNVVSALRYLNGIRACEVIAPVSDYRVNKIDDKQKAFHYKVKKVVTIEFDRLNVKKLISKYQKQSDEISLELDRIQLLTAVDYEPLWEMGTLFEDVVSSTTEP